VRCEDRVEYKFWGELTTSERIIFFSGTLIENEDQIIWDIYTIFADKIKTPGEEVKGPIM